MSKINQYAAMVLGMAAMAEAGMQDVCEFTNPYCDLLGQQHLVLGQVNFM